MPLISENPATGEVIAEYPEHDEAALSTKLDEAVAGFKAWRSLNFGQRGDCFRKLAKALRGEQKEALAKIVTAEMGKPIEAAEAEVDKCGWVCEYYADHAATFLKPEEVATDASKSYFTYSPLGVVLGIMPWNYPIWQVMRYAAPTLMAGNTTVLKHAKNVTGCALAIENLFTECGFPDGVFGTLIAEVPAVKGVIQDPRVAGVTLTGSLRAGRAVASQAGEALKKSVLELGGSDPFIVLEDADLDAAVEAGSTSRLLANGQTCIAAKRFIVPATVREDFEKRFVAKMSAAVMGDPMDRNTTLGPMARPDLRDSLHEQVTKSIAAGARALLGCEIPDGRGAFYPASVLTGCEPGMPAYEEEMFGPVAAIIEAKDSEDAIRIANDSDYGLGAVVFSEDVHKAEEIARDRLDAGCCFVNDFVKSDPRLPFGGIKKSGYGRELGSVGIKEFVNIKTVYIK